MTSTTCCLTLDPAATSSTDSYCGSAFGDPGPTAGCEVGCWHHSWMTCDNSTSTTSTTSYRSSRIISTSTSTSNCKIFNILKDCCYYYQCCESSRFIKNMYGFVVIEKYCSARCFCLCALANRISYYNDTRSSI